MMMGLGSGGDKGTASPSLISSNLSAYAPPFTVGRPVPNTLTDPVFGLPDNSYGPSIHYGASDPYAGLADDSVYGSIPYSASDTLADVVHSSGYPYVYPVSSAEHSQLNLQPVSSSGFSLYSNLHPAFSTMPSAEPVANCSWSPCGMSTSAYIPVASYSSDGPHGVYSQPYMYSGQSSGGVKSDPVEEETYYPSYVPPPLLNEDPSAASSCGVFRAAGEYNQSSMSLGNVGNGVHSAWEWSGWGNAEKPEKSTHYFYPRAGTSAGPSTPTNDTNQGNYASRILSTWEETGANTNVHDVDKPVCSTITEQSDGGMSFGSYPTYTFSVHSSKPVVGSKPTVSEHDRLDQYLKPTTSSWSVQMGQSTSYGIWESEADSSLAGNKSSFDHIKQAPSVYSTPSALCEFPEYINVGRAAATRDASNVSSPDPLLSSLSNVQAEANLLERQSGRNSQACAASSSTCNELLSGYRNDSDHMHHEIPGFQSSSGSPEGFSLGSHFNGVDQSVQNLSESSDYHNPAIDSPCWKGISFKKGSPFGSSDVVHPQLMKGTETCGSSEIFGRLNFGQAKISNLNNAGDIEGPSNKSNKGSVFQESDYVANVIASTTEGKSITGIMPEKSEPDVAEKVSSYPLEKDFSGPFRYIGHVLSEDEGDCILNRSASSSQCESFNVQRVLGKGRSTSEKANTVLDAESNPQKKPVDVIKNCSAHLPLDSAGSVLDSTLLESNSSPLLSKLDLKDSTPDIYVHGLVNAMHNLSELLLNHCSNNSCDMKEDDNDRLKHVIQNLVKCVRKCGRAEASKDESSSHQQATSQHNGEVPEVHTSMNVNLHQVERVAVINDKKPLIGHHSEDEQRYMSSGRQDLKPDSLPVMCDDVDTVEFDNMTQAIKKILNENFNEEETDPRSLLYKNLWLDAEAALCSLNYRSRFNRIKSEMEKCQLKKAEDVSLEKLQSSGSKSMGHSLISEEDGGNIPLNLSRLINNDNQSDNIMAKFEILGDRGKLSIGDCTPDIGMPSSKHYDLHTENKRAKDSTGYQTSDTSPHDSPFLSIDSHRDDWMARFNILKRRGDGSESEDSPDVAMPEANMKDQMGLEAKGHATSHISPFDSSTEDVMKRFHILTSRANQSVSENTPDVKLSSSKISSDLSRLEQLARDIGGTPTSDATHYGSSITRRGCFADDDTSKFLLPQADLSVFMETPDIQSSSNFASDINRVYQLPQGTGRGPTSDIRHNVSPAESTGGIPYDVRARLGILLSRADMSFSEDTDDGEELPSFDLKKVDQLQMGLKDCSMPDGEQLGSSIASTNCSANDFLARYYTLLSRDDDSDAEGPSNISGTAGTDPPGAISFLSDKSTHTERSRSPVVSLQCSTNSGTRTSTTDVWGPAMSVINFLKSQADNSCFMGGERQNLHQADGQTEHFLQDFRVDTERTPAVQNSVAGSPENMLAFNESHRQVENDPGTKSCMGNTLDQNTSGSYDNSFSDWEYVGKEELPAGMV